MKRMQFLAFVYVCFTGIADASGVGLLNTDLDYFRASPLFLSKDQAVKEIQERKIGSTPEKAIVALLFHLDGGLISAQFHDKNQLQPGQYQEYVTDLENYNRVMSSLVKVGRQNKERLEMAKPEYAGGFLVESQNMAFIFDPYQINYQEYDVTKEFMKKRMSKFNRT